MCLFLVACAQSEEREDQRELDTLRSLGYVQGTADPHVERAGVILNEKPTFEGYNFYTPRWSEYGVLFDMDGEEVHRWEKEGTGPWQHATLEPNGDIFVLVKDEHLLKLDAGSNELWRYEARVHHDLWVNGGGDIYVLTRAREKDESFDPRRPVVKDAIDVLSPDGRRKRRISLLDVIERSPFAYLVERWNGLVAQQIYRANEKEDEFDLLHSNHVEVFDGSLAERSSIFAKGNILTCVRNMNAVMIIDGRTEEILWLWGPNNLIFPHHPVLLPTGNVLVFNNGTEETGSQVLEVNPLTDEIEWTYGPTEGFFSKTRGSVQRLPNGNTLITESDTGYAFEVTAEGRKVWEFANPEREGKKRMAMWRVTRFAPDHLDFVVGGAREK